MFVAEQDILTEETLESKSKQSIACQKNRVNQRTMSGNSRRNRSRTSAYGSFNSSFGLSTSLEPEEFPDFLPLPFVRRR